ncbi:hypothetical protein L484_026670 [Morus notabilis]|uniref:Uncharacterized protein n=1 Tax=Morus notabilis TaxID=981085 RepID=W9SKK3_9ROSA|nr:hypothetical protein L484_026670 [Morus notabilis]
MLDPAMRFSILIEESASGRIVVEVGLVVAVPLPTPGQLRKHPMDVVSPVGLSPERTEEEDEAHTPITSWNCDCVVGTVERRLKPWAMVSPFRFVGLGLGVTESVVKRQHRTGLTRCENY